MKTIEERASEYGSKKGDISLSAVYNEALANIYKEGYIAGAEEQKAIDDEANYKQGYHDASEKFREWLKNNWREYVYQDGDGIIHFGHWESDFHKVMEE